MQTDLGAITQMEENLRNGVMLAKLAKHFAPEVVKKIFEVISTCFYPLTRLPHFNTDIQIISCFFSRSCVNLVFLKYEIL